MIDPQSIERQERELTDLLQRVLKGPLTPLVESMQELKKLMYEFEELVSEMRDSVPGVLSLEADVTRKQIQSLKKTISEETPREIQNSLQPQLDQFQEKLQQADTRFTDLNSVIAAGQGAIESSHRKSLEYVEKLQQTALVQLFAELESLRNEIGSRLTVQIADGQRSIVRIQELLNVHRQELIQHSASSIQQLDDEVNAHIVQLTQSMAQLRLVLNEQQLQLERQHAASERQEEQIRNGFLSLRKWLITSVCISMVSLTSVSLMAVGRLG